MSATPGPTRAHAPRSRRVVTMRFIAAAVILAAATASLQGVIGFFKIVLDKEPAPLRRQLDLMPGRFGPYVVIEKQDRLPKEVEETLGTNQYVSWVLKDTRKQPGEPGSAIRMHVPFYTGMIDTVPHVPDRCFVGGSGAQVMSKDLIGIQLRDPQHIHHVRNRVTGVTMTGKAVKLPGDELKISVIQFNRPGANNAYCVAYFFIANDRYVATPEGVRAQAFNAFDRYAYYAKVEVLPGRLVEVAGQDRFDVGVADPQVAADIVADFLVYALPEVMHCLPDWEQLNTQPRQPQSDRDEPQAAVEPNPQPHG